jgi:acyl-coenzyme A thioesterase PaaI-like protein
VKSEEGRSTAAAFYAPAGCDAGRQAFDPAPATAGPWSREAQHGGPPAALLGRAIEALDGAAGVVGRFTLELLGPVPVGPVEVAAQVLRPGRSVALCEATMYDATAGRAVAVARGWRFPAGDGGPGPRPEPLPHGPGDGVHHDPPPSWHRGYLDAMEWRWVSGAITRPGPAVVWMRQRIGLVDGEEPTGLQRLLACVDSASGVSAALDPAEWNFLNTDLTVHLLRPPEGEWFCVDARTDLGPGSVATALSSVYDERGLVARTAQALLVARRP